MKVNGKLKYNSAIIVNDTLIRELDGLLCEYFSEPKYSAELLNDDKIEFETVDELVSYDNYSIREIKRIIISAGLDNFIYIEPTFSFLSNYKSTVEMYFRIDDGDKSEEVKRKVKTLLDKHKQTIFYTLASKISLTHICILLMIMGFISNLYSLVTPRNSVIEVSGSTIISLSSVVAVIILLFSFGVYWIIKKLFPPIIFYLGENINKTERNSKLKSNVFWGIIVAAIVSATVSLVLR